MKDNKKASIIALSFIIAFGLLWWGVNFLKGKNFFTKERTFYALYNNVNGLDKTDPVVISGMRVGLVDDIYFDPSYNGNIIVKMLVTNPIPIPQNTIARITSSDIMGSKSINLIVGDDKVLASSGDTLKASVEAGLMEEVNAQVLPLKAKAESLISSIDSVVAVIQNVFDEESRRNINQSLKHITVTINNLENTTQNLDELLSVESSRISQIIDNTVTFTEALKDNADELNTVMTNASSISDSLSKINFAVTINKIDSTFTALNEILTEINAGQGSMGLLMKDDSLYFQLDKTITTLDELLEAVKENPKKYLKFSVF